MKKVMKALALALALCMVLSVSAFAEVTKNPTGDTPTTDKTNHKVSFTIEGLEAGEQVALLVLRKDAVLATADEDDILFIDQKAVAASATSVEFEATIAASTETVNNDVVDVYVGSESISKDKTGAWAVYENVEVANVSNITFTAGNVKYLNVGDNDGAITRPGAAIGININNVNITKMIWALNAAKENRMFSKAIEIDGTGLSGEVWFTAAFSSNTLKDYTIETVGAMFRGATDSEVYYAGDMSAEIANEHKATN